MWGPTIEADLKSPQPVESDRVVGWNHADTLTDEMCRGAFESDGLPRRRRCLPPSPGNGIPEGKAFDYTSHPIHSLGASDLAATYPNKTPSPN